METSRWQLPTHQSQTLSWWRRRRRRRQRHRLQPPSSPQHRRPARDRAVVITKPSARDGGNRQKRRRAGRRQWTVKGQDRTTPPANVTPTLLVASSATASAAGLVAAIRLMPANGLDDAGGAAGAGAAKLMPANGPGAAAAAGLASGSGCAPRRTVTFLRCLILSASTLCQVPGSKPCDNQADKCVRSSATRGAPAHRLAVWCDASTGRLMGLTKHRVDTGRGARNSYPWPGCHGGRSTQNALSSNHAGPQSKSRLANLTHKHNMIAIPVRPSAFAPPGPRHRRPRSRPW